MPTVNHDPEEKSSAEEIRERFDQLVEKFADLEAGQSTAVDGALMLELIADAAARTNPDAKRVLDVVLAGAVLHHLRTDEEWRSVFSKLHRSLRPGGSLWIADLVDHRHPAVREVIWDRYGRYLAELEDPDYRDGVLAYIEREDSPRPLLEQVDLLREVGFPAVEVLHKNSCFAAFGAVKEN